RTLLEHGADSRPHFRYADAVEQFGTREARTDDGDTQIPRWRLDAQHKFSGMPAPCRSCRMTLQTRVRGVRCQSGLARGSLVPWRFPCYLLDTGWLDQNPG